MDSERPSGIPWIVGTPRAGGGHTDLLALVLGRGWADTSIAGAGDHAVMASVLRRELTRPVEIRGGGVDEVDVHVDVDLQDTVVVITGTAAAVTAVAARLEVLLSRPEELVFDLPGASALPLAHPFAGWGRELAAWFGPGPATVFADVVPTWSGSVDDLHEALRALLPGATVAAIGATTVPDLADRLFTGGSPPAAGPVAGRSTALRWRTPTAGPLPGSVEHLMSVRVPGGTAGNAAMTLLLETLQRSFDVSCPVRGLYGSVCRVGSDQLLTVRAEPHSTLDPSAAAAAVDAALEALAALSPGVVDSALERHSSEEVLARRTGLIALAVAAMRSGRLQTPRELADAVAATGPDDVRAAVATLRENILLTRPIAVPDVRERASSTDIPGGSPKSMHSARMRSPTPAGLRFVRVLVNGRRLTQQRSSSQRGYQGHPQTVMDLERIVARLDIGADATLLIDDRDRRIQLYWATLRFPKRLRRILDGAVPAERVMTLESDGRIAASLKAYQRRAWRIVRAVFGVIALIGVLLVGVVLFTDNNGDADEPGAIIDTTIGQTATLPNGTTITVSDPRVADDPRNSGGLLLADVRYCAGSVQPSDVRDYEIRNYLDSSKFELYGTNNNRSNYRPAGVETFETTTLAAGECLDRTIVFEVLPADLPEAGMYVQFSNVVNDLVTWRGVQPTR